MSYFSINMQNIGNDKVMPISKTGLFGKDRIDEVSERSIVTGQTTGNTSPVDIIRDMKGSNMSLPQYRGSTMNVS